MTSPLRHCARPNNLCNVLWMVRSVISLKQTMTSLQVRKVILYQHNCNSWQFPMIISRVHNIIRNWVIVRWTHHTTVVDTGDCNGFSWNPLWKSMFLNLVVQRAKVTLKYGQCVGVGVVLMAKLVSVSEKWVNNWWWPFLFFNSS